VNKRVVIRTEDVDYSPFLISFAAQRRLPPLLSLYGEIISFGLASMVNACLNACPESVSALWGEYVTCVSASLETMKLGIVTRRSFTIMWPWVISWRA